MSTARQVELHLGDVVQLRKDHPCGAVPTSWSVVRLGADIGLRCHGCGHRIMLPRSTLERRLKGFVSRADPADASALPGEPEPGLSGEPSRPRPPQPPTPPGAGDPAAG